VDDTWRGCRYFSTGGIFNKNYMIMKAKIWEFFMDNTGKFSSSRLFKLLVAFSAIVDWQHAVWTTGVWHPDLEVLIFIAAVLGVTTYQHKIEQKNKKLNV
jgi:hypothetical protein